MLVISRDNLATQPSLDRRVALLQGSQSCPHYLARRGEGSRGRLGVDEGRMFMRQADSAFFDVRHGGYFITILTVSVKKPYLKGMSRRRWTKHSDRRSPGSPSSPMAALANQHAPTRLAKAHEDGDRTRRVPGGSGEPYRNCFRFIMRLTRRLHPAPGMMVPYRHVMRIANRPSSDRRSRSSCGPTPRSRSAPSDGP